MVVLSRREEGDLKRGNLSPYRLSTYMMATASAIKCGVSRVVVFPSLVEWTMGFILYEV